DPANWDNGVPDALDNAIIYPTANDPIINPGDVCECVSLEITDGGYVEVTGGSLTVTQGLVIYENWAGLVISGGTVDVGLSINVNDVGYIQVDGGSLLVGDDAFISFDGYIEINGGTVEIDDRISVFNLGHIWIDGGSLLVGDASFLLGGQMDLIDGSFEVDGEIYEEASSEIRMNGGTFTVDGRFEIEGADLDIGGGIMEVGDFLHIFEESELNIDNAEIIIGNDFIIENVTIDIGSGTIEVGDVLNITDDCSVEIDNAEIVVGNSFYIDEGTVVDLDSSLVTVENHLSVDSSNLNMSGGTLEVGGDFLNLDTLNMSGGVFIYNGSGAQSVGGVSYYNLEIDKSDGIATLGGNVTVTKDLTLSNGTLDVSGINRGISVGRSWINNDGTFNPRAGNVTFDGATTPGAIAGVNDTSFYDLTINKTNQTDVISMQNSSTASNMLTLTSGTLDVQSGFLNIPASATMLVNPPSVIPMDWNNYPTIKDTVGNLTFTVSDSAFLNIDGLNISDLAATGMDIASGVTFTNFKNISFQNNLGGAGSQHLKFTTDDYIRDIFEGLSFDGSTNSTGGYNVSVVDSNLGSDTRIFIPGATGAGAGEGFDNDDDANDDGFADAAGGVIAWTGAALLPEVTVDVIEGGGSDSYAISLTGKPTTTVAINISTDGQTLVTPTTLLFTPTTWFTAQTVTVVPVDDEFAEGIHTSTISHSISTIDPYYIGVSIVDVTANITDNETAGVSITESGGSTDVQEGSTTDTYTAVLTSKPTANVTVTIAPDGESTVDVNPLNFTDLNWNVAQTVEVTPVDDADNEGDHTSTITHSATSTDNSYSGIAIASVIANITDDEPFADAGNDYAANPGLLYLDGTGSSGITALTYSWTQTGGSVVTLTGSATATPSFYGYNEGAYTFQLTVTDEALNTDVDDVTVTVQNVAPVAVAVPDYFSMEMGDSKQLSGASSYDGNGTAIDSYTWNLAGASNPVADINTVLNSAAIASPIFTPTTAGVYSISLQVSSSGQNSALANITLVVIDFSNNVVPPVAYAGPGRTVALNTLVTLYGHDSLDADSLDEYPDLEFTWRQIDGPAVALSDTSVPKPTFTPVTAGWYKFGLTVRDAADDNIFSEEDTVTVLAFDDNVNYPPTAVPELKTFTDTNLDGEINAEETFTLTATNSKDPDSDVLTIQWQQISGPGYYTILPSDTAMEITYTPMLEGTYVFRLTVNDGSIDSAAVDLEIQVAEDETRAPIAKAFADGYATLLVDASQNVTVTLDGTQSTGDDGETSSGLTFQWRQMQGPTVEITNSATSIATFAPTISRTYEFQLMVTDPYGVTATDTVLVSVSTYSAVFNPAGNGVPKPVVTAPVISKTNEEITLNASNSVDNGNDPDGINNQNDGLVIFWAQTGGPRVMLDISNEFMPTFTPQVAGTYKFKCYVDDGADISPAQEIRIEVEEPPLIPGVTVSESPDSIEVTEGEAVIYSVVLNSQPTSRVIITVTSDYQSVATPSTLTFTSANWNYEQNVTITVTDDTVSESSQTSTISHSAASSDGDYDQINITNIVVQIIDND
ncbi:Ig-like domain-containing protein, partial [Planctomycetota bacterium]